MSELRDDLRPALFTGAATAVMGSVGGVLPALIHSLASASDPLAFGLLLAGDLLTVAAIGVGQGLAAAAAALWRGRGDAYVSPRRGLVGAAAVGAFDLALYLVQMGVPATELGWGPDLLILTVAGAGAGWLAVRPARPAVA